MFIVLRVNHGARPVQDDPMIHPHAVFQWGGECVLGLMYVHRNQSVFPAGVVHVKPIPKHISGRLDVL